MCLEYMELQTSQLHLVIGYDPSTILSYFLSYIMFDVLSRHNHLYIITVHFYYMHGHL